LKYSSRRLEIQRWKAQVETCRIKCSDLEREFHEATPEGKTRLLELWNEAMIEGDFAEKSLMSLEKEDETKGKAN
jgi:hypothetical protein